MKNIFVFPCGSEIALEIARSLKYSIHFHLIGGSSVDDHGRFAFDDIETSLPWENDPDFIPRVKEIVKRRNIDIIYPAMDSSIVILKAAEKELGCKVICASPETTEICLSKQKTYKLLSGVINVPKIFTKETIDNYPVFCKPDVGYGARGTAKINNNDELQIYLRTHHNSLICEYLTGDEYTVDCFTDRFGTMRFCGPRIRSRVSNGISVYTYPIDDSLKIKFYSIAEKINNVLKFRGAWFFQMKKNSAGELVLLEVAARFGGSSALYRARGVNFAELSLWDALDHDVEILQNDYFVEMDRALDNCFKIHLDYNEVFIDYDDTIILEKTFYNTDAVKFMCQCKNKGIKLSLLSRHNGDLNAELKKLALNGFFDRVIHISPAEKKSSYIDNLRAIFIDDSFAERLEVREKCKIPVFAPDLFSALINS